MKEFGVAVIGYGFMGKMHTYCYRNLPFFYEPPPAKIKLVAVCDARPEIAEKAKLEGGFEIFTSDPAEVISRKDVQIVDVCTPNQFHADAVLAAISAGKNIYCDKPITGSWEDALRVRKALAGYPGIGGMVLNSRFSPVALRARQLLDEGFVGKITQFRAGYFHAGSIDPKKPMGWKQDASAGGGVINDLGSHILDLADWLAGPFREVHAETHTLYPERPDAKGRIVRVDAEDAMTVLVRLPEGGLGVVEASKIATGSNDEIRIEIHGDKGAIRFNSMQPNYLEAYSLSDPEEPIGGMRGWKNIDTVNRWPKPGGWPGPKFAVGWIRSHVHCLYNFISAVAENRPASPSLQDGIRLQYLLEEVRTSARERSWRALKGI